MVVSKTGLRKHVDSSALCSGNITSHVRRNDAMAAKLFINR